MRRREIIALLAGGAFVRPFDASAQPTGAPVVGFLHAGAPAPNAAFVAAFRKGLSEAGFVDGQNVTIEYRWADGRDDRLPAMARR
jgi:putative ABC transport system substrate-binding protein